MKLSNHPQDDIRVGVQSPTTAFYLGYLVCLHLPFASQYKGKKWKIGCLFEVKTKREWKRETAHLYGVCFKNNNQYIVHVVRGNIIDRHHE